MPKDPEARAHKEWIGYVQPVGLVVSVPALLSAQAHVNRNISPDHQRFLGCLPQNEQGEPVPEVPDLAAFTRRVLGWEETDLIPWSGDDPKHTALEVALPEYNERLQPSHLVPEFEPADGRSPWLMLVKALRTGTPLDETTEHDDRHWQASPQAKFERLLRETEVPTGLLFNGRELRLVYAPRGETSGHVTFNVAEMATVAGRPMFAALHMLLSSERLFSLSEKQRLPAILADSRKYQNVVSTKLAEQVLAALYELLRGFQAADDQRHGELLREVLAEDPNHVYAGLLTVQAMTKGTWMPPSANMPFSPFRTCHIINLADDMGWSDLGCYGGEIATPNLDELAQTGVRLTQFYNAARCCPTRAALLTGLYPHQAGIGHMTGNDGIPSYQGFLNDRCATMGEALRPAGYTTLTTGKWHVGSAPGQWPLDRGFDRFWGTPTGGGVYFKETLQVRTNVFFVDGNERIEPPDDLYVTDTFTAQAMQFVEEAVTQTRKPFFLYLAHIAPHWPLQAKAEDIAKYRGRYDAGWDEVRRRRFQRQKAMGLVPPGAELSPRDPQARAWGDVPEAERRELAHRMEIYAAQIDCIDQNVGRLVARLKELGQFENTLLVFLSDNGCSAEGGPGGFSRGKPGAPIGTGLSYASAGLEWANASDTPLRKFKMDTYEGGIATPLIAHWPAGMTREASTKARSGRLVHEPAHVVDLMPTLLDVAGAGYPQSIDGKPLLPLEGRSLKSLLTGEPAEPPNARQAAAKRAAPERPLFWEHQGNKAVRVGDWKAVASKGGRWELYHLAEDRTEGRNVAETHPEKTGELAALWQAWAERCGVWEWDALQEHRRKRAKREQR